MEYGLSRITVREKGYIERAEQAYLYYIMRINGSVRDESMERSGI